MYKQNFDILFSKMAKIKNPVRKFYSCNVYHPSFVISSLKLFKFSLDLIGKEVYSKFLVQKYISSYDRKSSD